MKSPDLGISDSDEDVQLPTKKEEKVLEAVGNDGSSSEGDLKLSKPSQKPTPRREKLNSPKLSRFGESELQIAAKIGDEKRVRKLIDEGVNVNHRDYNKFTPLHDAVKDSVKNIMYTGGRL